MPTVPPPASDLITMFSLAITEALAAVTVTLEPMKALTPLAGAEVLFSVAALVLVGREDIVAFCPEVVPEAISEELPLV